MQLGDGRKLDQGTQEALRVRAVFLVEKGATHMEAALAVGVHRGTVSRWCGAFRRNGTSGIEKGKRGRRAGDQLILTEVEARRVQRWIRDKMPDQMQLPFALWTAQAVRELIHKKLGKTLGLSTMQLYLNRHSPDSCRVVRHLPRFRVLGNPAPLARAVDGDGTSRRHAER